MHILTDDSFAQTDTWQSGLNNNVLIFGPSGAGKTRHYVTPNVLCSHESMIISDTKGSLYAKVGPALSKRGYKVLNVDFTDLSQKSSCGYDPLDAIRYDERSGHYKEQDINTLCQCFVDEMRDEPFWSYAARQYLRVLIAYCLENPQMDIHPLAGIRQLLPLLGKPEFDALLEELDMLRPGNMTSQLYPGIRTNTQADRTHACINAILSANLDPILLEEAVALYQRPDRIDFASLGREKIALFLTISDTDRSMDKLAGAFMTQAIQTLCYSADHDYPNHQLPVPVRFYLDDFATNLFIPDFDNIVSVIRSREISVSIILQSITQLNSLYGPETAKTIINNCDRQLYLGGQDIETARYIAERANRPLHTILDLPLEDAYLLVRGQRPRLSRKFDLNGLAERLESLTSQAEADGQSNPLDGFLA